MFRTECETTPSAHITASLLNVVAPAADISAADCFVSVWGTDSDIAAVSRMLDRSHAEKLGDSSYRCSGGVIVTLWETF